MDFLTELEDLIDRAMLAGVERSEIISELAMKAQAMSNEDAEEADD